MNTKSKLETRKVSQELSKKGAGKNDMDLSMGAGVFNKPSAGANSKSRVSRRRGGLKRHLKYLVPQYRLILIKEPGVKPTAITDPISFQHFVQPLAHYSEEHFIAFHLDVKFQVIGYHEVSKGTLSASLVHPREVFKAAILANSYAIIVAHNHPSGSIAASSEDIETTKTLIKAGKLLGIEVIDHCIVSSESMNSLRESEPQLWFS